MVKLAASRASPSRSPLWWRTTRLGSGSSHCSKLSSAGLAVVLVIFMLIDRRELRNRLLRVAGHAHVAVTTRALDEAGQRISRYLLMHTAINATFGIVIGGGLFLIGLPYALLCGFLAAVLRFIPYVGPVFGIGLPVMLSLAVLPGWHGPLLVIALVLVAELVCNLVLEPWLYGQSAGVSQVALLIAIAFWTWLWGPVGLVVATPLTVCLVVLARHVPEMEFLAVLLGDEPPLDLYQRLYQRLLSGDAEEAAEIAREFAVARPTEHFYDELLLPALVRMRGDQEHHRISSEDEERMLGAAREVVTSVAAAVHPPTLSIDPEAAAHAKTPARVAAFGAEGEIDRLAVAMLRDLVASPDLRLTAWWGSAEEFDDDPDDTFEAPEVACIVALSRSGIGAARRLAQRLRRRSPAMRVIVVAWRGVVEGGDATPAMHAGERAVVGSLLEARDRIWTALALNGNGLSQARSEVDLAETRGPI